MKIWHSVRGPGRMMDRVSDLSRVWCTACGTLRGPGKDSRCEGAAWADLGGSLNGEEGQAQSACFWKMWPLFGTACF